MKVRDRGVWSRNFNLRQPPIWFCLSDISNKHFCTEINDLFVGDLVYEYSVIPIIRYQHLINHHTNASQNPHSSWKSNLLGSFSVKIDSTRSYALLIYILIAINFSLHDLLVWRSWNIIWAMMILSDINITARKVDWVYDISRGRTIFNRW